MRRLPAKFITASARAVPGARSMTMPAPPCGKLVPFVPELPAVLSTRRMRAPVPVLLAVPRVALVIALVAPATVANGVASAVAALVDQTPVLS